MGEQAKLCLLAPPGPMCGGCEYAQACADETGEGDASEAA